MSETKRKKQAIITKKRILNTALNLMKKHSIDEISVNDICKKAKVGVGTFYYYYKSKDDILLEVFQELDANFVKLYETRLLETISPYDYILRHCRCYTDFVTEKGVDFTRKTYSIQSKFFVDKNRPLYLTLSQFLTQMQQENVISPSVNIEALCRSITICMRGITHDWFLHEGNYNLTEAAIVFVETFLEKYKPSLTS